MFQLQQQFSLLLLIKKIWLITIIIIIIIIPNIQSNQSGEPDEFVKEVLEKKPGSDYCRPHGMVSDSCCDYVTIENINAKLLPKIKELLKTPFFSHYKVNLNKECPFYNANNLCSRTDCTVSTLEDSEVPPPWLSQKLGEVDLRLNMGLKQIKRLHYTDKDFCVPEDEEDIDGVYVNLLNNPERFTGYAGDSAQKVWKAIYEENCFQFLSDGNKPLLPALLSNDLLMGLCMEKRVFYRLVSGLHASISTHICREYYNTTTDTWGPNLDCFISRVGAYPDRLENLYFDYMILLRAVTKVSSYLKDYDYCGNDKEQTKQIKKLLKRISKEAKECPATFDERRMFVGDDSKILKREFKEHFRNISQLMDCTGCQKCRLWGKIQTGGFGTALKILFSYEEKSLNPKINPGLFQKTEIVALLNTFGRLSESIESVGYFRELYLKRQEAIQMNLKEKGSEKEKEKLKFQKFLLNLLDNLLDYLNKIWQRLVLYLPLLEKYRVLVLRFLLGSN